MAKDIVPDSHEHRLEFLKKLKALLAANATALNLPPAYLASTNAMLDELITLYQTLVDAEKAHLVASAGAAGGYALKEGTLRELFNYLKYNSGMNDGLAVEMGLYTQSSPRATAQSKPHIKADAQPGHVRISGSKDYADRINIYMRLAGTIEWKLVGARRQRLPFHDTTPLKTPGVPETREYQARGVNGDEEVGQYSDIVTVTFAG